jgi:phosphoglycolate phosphatase
VAKAVVPGLFLSSRLLEFLCIALRILSSVFLQQVLSVIKAIVFDLDGTLLNTLESIGNAFNRSLRKMDMPTHEIDRYRYFIGDGVFNCARRCLPSKHCNEKNINKLVEIERLDYARSWKIDAQPYDGIQALLDCAQGAGYRLAVLTNKDDVFAQQCVRHFFPTTNFDCIVGHSSGVPHKPDATGGFLIAGQLGLATGELAMIGDTSIDIHTAQACNMFSVGVLWGFREIAELEEAGADRIIEHPNQLLDILASNSI